MARAASFAMCMIEGMTSETEIRVETLAGMIIPRLESNGEVTVNMGRPNSSRMKFPSLLKNAHRTYRLDIDGKRWKSVLFHGQSPRGSTGGGCGSGAGADRGRTD